MYKRVFLLIAVVFIIPAGVFAVFPQETLPTIEPTSEVNGVKRISLFTPEEILEKSDMIRSPNFDFSVEVIITSFRSNRETTVSRYETMIKEKDKTLVKSVYPPRDKGRIILMRGWDLWIYLPTVSRPIRISPRERLFGEVSYGDIARINFTHDYNPVLLGIEKIDEKEYYVLELNAENERVTYHKVIYFVEKNTFNPFKAEFYAVSGILLKECLYEDYRYVLGESRPMKLIITDKLVKGKKSIMEYKNMTKADWPEKIFNKFYLKKLK